MNRKLFFIYGFLILLSFVFILNFGIVFVVRVEGDGKDRVGWGGLVL